MAVSPRARRWIKIALVAGVLIAVLAWWVDRQLEPNRLTKLVLDRAGQSLQLDIRFQGQPDYALRPEPRLRVPGLSVRAPGGKEFLSAAGVEISLPWATLTGGEPVITRVELDKPHLDLPGLQAWLATRPKTPFKLPTLSKGIEIHDGILTGDGFELQDLQLALPRLKSGEAAELQAKGRLVMAQTRFDFDTETAIATAGAESGFTLNAKLLLDNTPKSLQAKLQTRGSFALSEARQLLLLDSVSLTADSPLPSLGGKGRVELAQDLRFTLDATLRHWPADWPALPSPLAEDAKDLPLLLEYRGDKALASPMQLHLSRGNTVLDANLKLPEALAWTDQAAGTPLPPLAGTLKTPHLNVDGAELDGVEIEISQDPASAP